MIDTENLRTASLYINNQLLSRGLLRDGDTIDFAGTWLRDEEDAAVSGRIISLLNDLILRRDRDAEQRESLSMSMRSLRAENLKLTDDLARLHEKHTDARRKADLATAAESTFKTQLKSAEAHARALKEDAARMKSLVAQTRSSCTMEIRRRDRQIDTLKKQLGEAGRSRGTRANPAITTITVTGEVGSHEWNPTTTSLNGSNNTSESSADADPTLRFMENETILGLARRLTEENDSVTGLMQDTMEQLRDMSGWAADTKSDEHVRKQPLLEDMVAELDAVMDHMRVILTNPSFVPIEEVVAREEEINRLKAGWVKMENRWKEAVHLMDGWRKRMAVSGKPVCDEELQMGIRLSPIRVQDMNEGSRPTEDHGLSVVKEESEEENGHEFLRSPCPENSDSRPGYAAREELELDDRGNHTDSDDDVAHHQDDLPMRSEDECSASHGKQPTQHDFSHDDEDESLEPTIPLAEPPQPAPLRHSHSAGNRGTLKNEKLRTRTRPSNDRGTTSGETTHRPSRDPKTMRSMPVRPGRLASQSTRLPSRATKTVQRPRFPSNTSLDEALLPPKRAAEKEDTSSAPQSQNEEAEESDELQAAAATIKAHETGRQQQTSTTSASSHTSSSSSSPTTPRASNSRRTRRTPRDVEATVAQSPPAMSTIAAKLAASEREADAARVRAKLKAARTSTRGVSRPTFTAAAASSSSSSVATTTEDKQSSRDVVGKAVMEARAPQMELQRHENKEEEEREIKTVQVEDALVPQPEKRKRDRKASAVSSRRRSTLTPRELRTLMEGEVQ
ncbi:hypothetical protein E4U09_006870 [Claviceps aff. purpurea]|uniref:NIMA interactive protein n=1 Tax=Claviceps aff. purpurea TaxID=1967640 RepID=A0A9P7TZW9_9HYPO|nr:hypothetical protein E4U09_006870 [Claviceps aff. purpurea]